MPQFQFASGEQEHSQYKVVLASCSTTQVSTIGDAAVGDYLHRLIVVPASSGAGVVTLFDGTTAVLSIPAVAGSGTGVTCPPPYSLFCGMAATSTKAWNITCGAAVHAIAVGRFNR